MTAGVDVEYVERIAIVRLMRPDKLNALNASMFTGFFLPDAKFLRGGIFGPS